MPVLSDVSFRYKSASAGRVGQRGSSTRSGPRFAFELGKHVVRALFLLAGALAQPLCCHAAAEQPTPFTVQNSVEWTRILSAGTQRSVQPPPNVLFSPDRAHLLIHTRRGDVARNANVERVLAFDVKAIEAYLGSQNASPPRAQVLAEVVVRQDSNQLTSIIWVDEQRVGFLAEGANGVLQVFIADLVSGSARQVTSTENGVASFAVAGDVLLFYAYRATLHSLVQPVDDQILYTLIGRRDPTDEAVELFASSVSSGVTVRIDQPAARILPQYRTIWISPSGRHGVVLVPALAVPSHWAAYRAGAPESRFIADAAVPEPDSVTALLSSKLRYAVVDLETREVRPLLDAPSGSIAQTLGPTAVYWPDGERSVIVSHTYLPLNVGDERERTRRASGPAIAEVDLTSGAATVIAWEPEAGSLAGGDFNGLIRSAEIDPSSATLHVRRQAKSGAVRDEYFRKTSSRWRQISEPRNSDRAQRLSVDVRQALNERPKVYARAASSDAKMIFDPNPDAVGLACGRTEVMTWTDDNRLPWRGGLVYPSGYVVGTKYPLILQTHGFRADRFLLDGPTDDVGTAYAAQALASAGFLVLQASESPAAVTSDEREARLVAQGWQAAIRELGARGLIDPQKIGIIAFSRTCMHAIRFLADFPQAAGAVTLADGPWWGYANQMLLANHPQSTVDHVLRTTGGEPDPHHLQEWFDAQPLYKLANARAAIRIEAMGPDSVVALWETFAVLQNAARPVDMLYFPQGAHNLMKPVERMGSQQGNVDWFRFWLKGEEDADPRKAAQYERWRRLRSRLL
jgi:dipeptidyl aminopeptidase/acylaminoacyl peptidase